MAVRNLGQARIISQPGDGPLAGRPNAAHWEAKAMGKHGVAFALPVEHFDEHFPLPQRQSRDRAVQAIALVTAHNLGAWITFSGAVVDQQCRLRLAELHFPACPDGQVHALAAADGYQPRAEPVSLGQLAEVSHTAQPRELNGVIGVIGR